MIGLIALIREPWVASSFGLCGFILGGVAVLLFLRWFDEDDS